MDKELNRMIMTMKQSYDKDISIYDRSFLIKNIEKRKTAIQTERVEDYIQVLEEDPKEAENFYESFNIHYSQFFREPFIFTLLEQVILSSIINNKPPGREIRVWSAGCSHGQEPYSIAILLSEFAEIFQKVVRFRIFATDISQEAVSIGQAGIYNQDAIKNVKMMYLDKYFVKQGETYMITPQLKKNISFLTYDLLDKTSINPPESIYGDFDIVMCSNVLFYYKTEVQQFIINKLQKATSSSGYLITGEAERVCAEKVSKLTSMAMQIPIFQNVIR